MSTAPLPLSPFVSQSQSAHAGPPADGHTLTLQLRAMPGATAGRLMLRQPAALAPDTVQLRIAQPPQAPLTFTA
jgi:hypothetical protein